MYPTKKWGVPKDSKPTVDTRSSQPQGDLKNKKTNPTLPVSKYVRGPGNMHSRKESENNAPSEVLTISDKLDSSRLREEAKQSTHLTKNSTTESHKKLPVANRNFGLATDKKLAAERQKVDQLQGELKEANNNIGDLNNRVYLLVSELEERSSESQKLRVQNQDLNRKLNKMRQHAEENKKALRKRITEFNQQGSTQVQMQKQIQALRQQNQILSKKSIESEKSTIIMRDSSIMTDFAHKQAQWKNQKFQQSQPLMSEAGKSESNKIQALKKGYDRLLKQIQEEFQRRVEEKDQKIIGLVDEIEKLQQIIDRFYQEGQNKSCNLKLGLDTDSVILQKCQQNQLLRDQNRTLKNQIFILKIEKEKLANSLTNNESLLTAERLKSQKIVVEVNSGHQKDQLRAVRSGFQEGGSESNRLNAEIQSLRVQVEESKKLVAKYYEQNNKKDEIIKMLSAPRKTNVHK